MQRAGACPWKRHFRAATAVANRAANEDRSTDECGASPGSVRVRVWLEVIMPARGARPGPAAFRPEILETSPRRRPGVWCRADVCHASARREAAPI